MHRNTKTAIEKLAKSVSLNVSYDETDDGNPIVRLHDEIDDGYAETYANAVQLDNGRWVNAYRKNGQWRSSDKPNAEQGYRYSFANYPEGLDVRSYPSATACLRSALRDSGVIRN